MERQDILAKTFVTLGAICGAVTPLIFAWAYISDRRAGGQIPDKTLVTAAVISIGAAAYAV